MTILFFIRGFPERIRNDAGFCLFKMIKNGLRTAGHPHQLKPATPNLSPHTICRKNLASGISAAVPSYASAWALVDNQN
jgi:hypothetical protein